MSVDEKEAVIRLVRRVMVPDRPPELVHHFFLIRVSDDVLLEMGYLDLAEINLAIEHSRETNAPVDANLFIGHRFQLSLDALRRLVEAGTQILNTRQTPVEHEVTK
jgi:hypothetical protein